jgi:hypothetical protein
MEAPTADEKPLVFHHSDMIEDWIAEHAEHFGGRPT